MRTALFVLRLLPALVAFGRALHRAADPTSPGGRRIDTAERPPLNELWWRLYDKATYGVE